MTYAIMITLNGAIKPNLNGRMEMKNLSKQEIYIFTGHKYEMITRTVHNVTLGSLRYNRSASEQPEDLENGWIAFKGAKVLAGRDPQHTSIWRAIWYIKYE